MYETLKLFPYRVNCYYEGHIASAATIAMCGASKIITTPYTTFLLHELSADFGSKHTVNKSIIGWHDTLMGYVADIYSKKTNGKITQDSLKEEIFLTSEQAKDIALVDQIITYVRDINE